MSKIDYTDEFLRKRKERQKKARKRRLIAWFIFIMFLLLAVGVVLSLTVLFPIKNISFSGSKIYTEQQIFDASGIKLEDNLFTVSKKDTLDKLREKLPFIETVEFKRTLPDTLNVTVSDAKKYACYQSGDKYYTVSHKGWVLEETEERTENVFLVIVEDIECSVGKELIYKNDKTKSLIDEIVNYLNSEEISIDYVDVSNELNLKVGVEARFEVEFGNDNFLESKIKHLNGMIDGIEENKSGTINLSMWNSQNRQGTFVQNNTN